MSSRYAASEAMLDRARNLIPLGAQTFSKSVTQLPLGAAPLFAQRGKGARMWDADGNEYVDFVNGLLSISLGYADPDVNAAVAAQLEQGTIFSLSHELELKVAELIVELVPSAEMVRFGKNGSDATAGAIRAARAFTGRDHVLVCGYHGWQDWYIASTSRNKGIPEATRALTHTFPYNDIAALETKLAELRGQVAAVIMEPMNVTPPKPGYLEAVRDLTRRDGVVLVFDETITGFRYANGGAQERFGVVPDLTTLGKGIANGFPLSAVCGRKDIMMEFEEVFFSFTMGGETLSLAAAHAVLSKLKREPVTATMRTQGEKVIAGVTELIAAHDVGHFCSVAGDATWSFFNIADANGYSSFDIKTLWMQEMLRRGILTIGTHNISYAHGDTEIGRLLLAYGEVLPILAQAVSERTLHDHLECEPLRPLFKVR